MTPPWRIVDDGLELVVRLTPKGGRDRIDGVASDPAGRPLLLVRVAAPPVDGAANKALLKFLAKACGTAKSRIRIMAGETSRIKRLRLDGDANDFAQKLTALLP